MLELKLYVIIFWAARICLYARCLHDCIGSCRISKKIAAAAFAVFWIAESFLLSLSPLGREIELFEFFLLLVEMPCLFVLAFCFSGTIVRRLFAAVFLPVVYWFGEWSIRRMLFSTASFYRQYLASASVCVLFLAVFTFLISKIKTSRQERERAMLKQELRMYEKQFHIIRQSQHHIRSLKHDMKHHIKMLSDLVAAGEKDAALDYLASMGEFMENTDAYVDSGNEKIDSILNYMLAKAQKAGICTSWTIQIPEHLELSAFDMNVILSNLMENAINALDGVPSPSLNLRIKYDRGTLCISTKNNNAKKSLDPYRLRTSSEHGYGLKNIQKIAEKHHGSLETSVEDGFFCVSVLLFLSVKELSQE